MKGVTTMTSSVLTTLTFLLIGGAPDLRGQMTPTEADETAVRIERAELLAQHGIQLARLGHEYEEAVSYLREAASLWGTHDEAVEALSHAGHFAWHAGRGLISVSAFNHAGETALELGDFARAAEAFVAAAWVAAQEGEVDTAETLVDRSRELLDSGRIEPGRKAAIESRIGTLLP